jgi:protein-tyrosine phosphatase
VLRRRQLFRSDSLHRMTDADVEVLIDELGVRTVVDLRTTRERDECGPVAAEEHPSVRAHHLPLVDQLFAREEAVERPPVDDLGAGYVAMLTRAGEQVAGILRLLAEPEALPAVFYCAAGKDRTGALAGVVLGLLGVDDDDIVADYALTDPIAASILERVGADLVDYEELWGRLPADARRAPAHVMTSMLAAIRQNHGSVEGFADSLGVGPDVVARLREALLI